MNFTSRAYLAATVTMAIGLGVSNVVLQERLYQTRKKSEEELRKYKTWYTAAINQMSPQQMLKMMDDARLEGSQNLQGL